MYTSLIAIVCLFDFGLWECRFRVCYQTTRRITMTQSIRKIDSIIRILRGLLMLPR